MGQSMKNLESVLVTRVKPVLEMARRVFADAWEEATEVPYERLLALPEPPGGSWRRPQGPRVEIKHVEQSLRQSLTENNDSLGEAQKHRICAALCDRPL